MFHFNKAVHVVKYRILWMVLSACLLLPGICAMVYSMITYPTHSPVKVGIDYTGGTILQYGVADTINNEAVVIFESKILVNALSKPELIAVNKFLPAFNSSFVLSKIKMLASTAIPTDRMKPIIGYSIECYNCIVDRITDDC